MPNGTSQLEKIAAFNLIQEGNLSDRIKLFCFDTTACNTGLHASAYLLSEKNFVDVELSESIITGSSTLNSS